MWALKLDTGYKTPIALIGVDNHSCIKPLYVLQVLLSALYQQNTAENIEVVIADNISKTPFSNYGVLGISIFKVLFGEPALSLQNK